MPGRVMRGLLLVFGMVFFGVVGWSGEAARSQSQPFLADAPAGSAITYQGWLQHNGEVVEGVCDLRFALFDNVTNGTQVGSTLERPNQTVTGGYFTVSDLDFGAAFMGEARWIEVAVRCPAGSGDFTTLTPRQPLTPAPYALYALHNWSLLGNAGTGGSNFVGTTDAVTMTVKVSDTVALRFLPSATSPNIVGGIEANEIVSGVVGAMIGGGGEIQGNIAFGHRVTDDYGVVVGGSNNQAGDGSGTTSDRTHAFVGGGRNNTATGDASTIGGGQAIAATGQYATVAGGVENNALADGATVGGGAENGAMAAYATVSGGIENVATGNNATVSGGFNNDATGENGTVGGGEGNQATNSGTTISGGVNNIASQTFATVAGGTANEASGQAATIGGGLANLAGAIAATVSGGFGAHASHYGEWAYASGTFVDQVGSAQSSMYVLRGTTNNNGLEILTLDNDSALLTIADGRTVTFDIQIAARGTTGEAAGYSTRGVIENDGGTTTILGGNPAVSVLGEDDNTWDVTVSSDDTTDSLQIEVKGGVGDSVRWVATVRTTEVQN